MNEFLASNDWQWWLLRTIVQGVLGVVIANLELIIKSRGSQMSRDRSFDSCVLGMSIRSPKGVE